MAKETLYDMWADRNPRWERRYEEVILRNFTDYGKGNTSMRENKGKLFGAGYEILIVAFFLGLYKNQRRKLNPDSNELKVVGQPIKYWGNIESRNGRNPYPKLREYIFMALVARTDLDLLAVEKGEMLPSKAVGELTQTMEEYINYGLHYMEDKLIYNPGHFHRESAFLEEFLGFATGNEPSDNSSTPDEPESLD